MIHCLLYRQIENGEYGGTAAVSIKPAGLVGGMVLKKEAAALISFDNTMGKVSMSGNYFAELVAIAAQSGYGVAGMAIGGPADSLKSFLRPDFPEKGVKVSQEDGKLVIELHIKVIYGLNIAAAVKSITHKVKYIVEEATGLQVKRINVCVDDVVA